MKWINALSPPQRKCCMSLPKRAYNDTMRNGCLLRTVRTQKRINQVWKEGGLLSLRHRRKCEASYEQRN